MNGPERVRTVLAMQAADYHVKLDQRDVEGLLSAYDKARALLIRYRRETPLGHQPHMIAHEVDALLARESTR